jgi:hypothetical protein
MKNKEYKEMAGDLYEALLSVSAAYNALIAECEPKLMQLDSTNLGFYSLNKADKAVRKYRKLNPL